MEKKEAVCEYESLVDMLAEMVTTYLTKQPKGEGMNE